MVETHLNSSPLVSVLMTSYNRERYIGAAIESVLNSNYKEFELIICDDGSKDKTVEIARSYAEKDNRVKVYINEKNLGDYPNRNHAAAYATGKYLKYVDADDYLYPWGLQILVQSMEQFPEAGFGLCSLEQFVEKPFPFMLSPREAYLYNYKGPGLFHKAPLSSIIRRDAFNDIGGFSPTIKKAGDFEMWHRMAQKFSVVLMPHGVVWYREHDEQESNTQSKFSYVYENVKVTYLNDSKTPLSKEECQQIIKAEKVKVIKGLCKGILKMRFAVINEKLTMIKQYYAR